MQRDHGAKRNHGKTQPTRRLDSLHRLGVNPQQDRIEGGRVGRGGCFAEPSQRARGGFIEDK